MSTDPPFVAYTRAESDPSPGDEEHPVLRYRYAACPAREEDGQWAVEIWEEATQHSTVWSRARYTTLRGYAPQEAAETAAAADASYFNATAAGLAYD